MEKKIDQQELFFIPVKNILVDNKIVWKINFIFLNFTA